jgi:hypothetical protein
MIKNFGKKVKKLRKDRIWFDDEMFLYAARLYDRPIIVFSHTNKMAYFESEFLTSEQDLSQN